MLALIMVHHSKCPTSNGSAEKWKKKSEIKCLEFFVEEVSHENIADILELSNGQVDGQVELIVC